MLFKLIGVQHYDFVSQDGKEIRGNKLHLLDERSNVAGMELGYRCLIVNLNDDLKNKLYACVDNPSNLINKNLNIDFNSYGKIDCLSIAK